MRRISVLTCSALILAGPTVVAQEKMTTYQLVLLSKGPVALDDERARPALDAHRAYMLKLGAERTMLAAGPFTDGAGLLGAFVMGVPSPASAREIEMEDPGVKAGLFVVSDVLSFMAPEGWFQQWSEPFGWETVHFGFLNSGPTRGQDSETAKRLQSEHLAYMEAQAKEGALVLAGPFINGGVRRGVVVYRVATAEEARRRAEGDPAVKAGRLAVELHPWQIPRGALR